MSNCTSVWSSVNKLLCMYSKVQVIFLHIIIVFYFSSVETLKNKVYATAFIGVIMNSFVTFLFSSLKQTLEFL